MASAADLTPKVSEWLNEMFHSVEHTDSGGFFVPHFGSTALFIGIDDVFDGRHTRVRIDAPILLDVPVNGELLQYIGYRSNDFLFGSFVLIREDQQQLGILAFRQTLLGDALDKIELEAACHVVAITADNVDNDLQLRFGGRLFAG